jgi:hypothetical protein
MANRELLAALRLFHEAATCPCMADNLCPGCVAKNDQIAQYVPKFLYEQLGDLKEDPKKLCQFYGIISTAHEMMHIGGSH